jgi:hypothetical protein
MQRSLPAVLYGRRCDNSVEEKQEVDDTAERLLHRYAPR